MHEKEHFHSSGKIIFFILRILVSLILISIPYFCDKLFFSEKKINFTNNEFFEYFSYLYLYKFQFVL